MMSDLVTRSLAKMMEAFHTAHPSRRRLSAPAPVVRSLGIPFVVSLAVVSLVFARVSAQVPPVPGQQPPAGGATSTSGLAPSNIPGSVTPAETPAAEKTEEPPTPAERQIDEAAAAVAKLQSIAADVEESVTMLNHQFTIKGRYLKAPDRRVNLRLTVSGLPDTRATTLQICDGVTLWDYQSVLDSTSYRKLSIKPIVERLNSPEIDPKLRDQALAQMGFAGPETLLVGLRRAFRFELREDAQLDGRKVWIFRGTWKSRQGLAGPDARPVAPSGLLPPYIPSDASLYLGKDDHWPYKLVLQGRQPTILLDTRKMGPDGRRIGSKSSIDKVVPTAIVLAYSNVRLNPTIRPDEFAFQAPPNSAVDDSTELIVRQLDQAIQVQADKKKAEAAKKEGTVLEQTIDIPPPPRP
jgi:outer membrane lipoprotein-sorting protein